MSAARYFSTAFLALTEYRWIITYGVFQSAGLSHPSKHVIALPIPKTSVPKPENCPTNVVFSKARSM